MPTPRENETESQFVARCVIDDEATRDFPDVDQRIAFCHSQFEREQKNNIISKQVKANWRGAFENERRKAEKAIIGSVQRFYQTEYAKGVDAFIQQGTIQLDGIFKTEGFKKIYEQLYVQTGMRFANWYARNFDRFLKKGVNPNQYQTQWQNLFGQFAQQNAGAKIKLVQGTALKTMQRILKANMNDPAFAALGARQKRDVILRQTNLYSRNQALRLVRTEATAAANYGTLQSATTIFPAQQMMKQWVSGNDGRTRSIPPDDFDHVVMNGKQVKYEDDFKVRGELMAFPADSSKGASAGNIINCRCSVFPFPMEDAQAIGQFESIGFGIGAVQPVLAGTETIAATQPFVTQATQATTAAVDYSAFRAKTKAQAQKIANDLGIKNFDFDGLNINIANEYLVTAAKIKDRFGFVPTRLSSGKGMRNMINKKVFDQLMEESADFRDYVSKFGIKAMQKDVARINRKILKKMYDDGGIANHRVFREFLRLEVNGKVFKISMREFDGIMHSMKYKNVQRLRESIAYQRSRGFFAEGSNGVDYVAMHEFGHALDHAVGFAKSKTFKDLLAKYRAKGDDWIAENLSSYGISDVADDASELIAEAFAEYITSPNPRLIAREVGEALEKYLKLNLKNFKITAAKNQDKDPKQTIPFVLSPQQLKKYI